MNCPFCSQPLVVLELNQVEIDYCTNCHGIWLDEGELEIILEDSGDVHNLLNSFVIDKKSKETSINCPICEKKMDKVLCGDENKITLDKCSRQHGIWFNKGELQDVVRIGSFDKENKILNLLNEMFSYNLKN